MNPGDTKWPALRGSLRENSLVCQGARRGQGVDGDSQGHRFLQAHSTSPTNNRVHDLHKDPEGEVLLAPYCTEKKTEASVSLQ